MKGPAPPVCECIFCGNQIQPLHLPGRVSALRRQDQFQKYLRRSPYSLDPVVSFQVLIHSIRTTATILNYFS